MAALGRRGVFFSIISAFIIMLFEISGNISTELQIQETKLSTTRVRVEFLNEIMRELDERYFERMLYVASKNALYGVTKYYSDNTPAIIQDPPDIVLRNRTIGDGRLVRGIPSPVPVGYYIDLKTLPNAANPYIKPQYTFDGLIASLEAIFTDRLDIRIEQFDIEIDKIEQKDPWYITIGATIKYYFRDNQGMASWKGEAYKEVQVSVCGLYTYPHTPEYGYTAMELIRCGPGQWKEDAVADNSDPDCDTLYPDGSYWCYRSAPAGVACFTEPSFLNKMMPSASTDLINGQLYRATYATKDPVTGQTLCPFPSFTYDDYSPDGDGYGLGICGPSHGCDFDMLP